MYYMVFECFYNKIFVSFLTILDYNIPIKRNLYTRFSSKYIYKNKYIVMEVYLC
jgi:hypothetical protein